MTCDGVISATISSGLPQACIRPVIHHPTAMVSERSDRRREGASLQGQTPYSVALLLMGGGVVWGWTNSLGL